MQDPARSEYAALTAKVDAFADAVSSRCASQMSCRSGCAGCCQVDLTVSAVEASTIVEHLGSLSATERRALCEEDVSPLDDSLPRCVFLSVTEQCQIYPVRPLVCRSQGLPLRYPSDFLPEDVVRVRVGGGSVTVCPLNFVEQAPSQQDVLDAERVDQILAIVNLRHCQAHELDPTHRVSLRALRDSVRR
ncbi:MAG: YkgJ family cysteine cluster protein [Polyangia bacterium]